MREGDGIGIIGPGDGEVTTGRQSTLCELISAAETGNRWAFGEVTAAALHDSLNRIVTVQRTAQDSHRGMRRFGCESGAWLRHANRVPATAEPLR
jgi:hypothetical protein